MKLSVLMTVYNEKEFVEYAIRSCLPYVDHLVVVEGAYQEVIDLIDSETPGPPPNEHLISWRRDRPEPVFNPGQG